jgi:hypothetical protein
MPKGGRERTQFKKGNNANPRGAGAHDPIKRELKRITNAVYTEIIECALKENIVGLEKIAKDPATPAMQVGIARALGRAISKGDWSILNSIVERLVGRQANETRIRFPDGLPAPPQPQTVVTKVILTLPKNGRELKRDDE